MKEYNVAIVGPLGTVGKYLTNLLVQRNFPVKEIKFLGTEVNKGKEIKFKDKIFYTEVAEEGAFKDVDIAFFCVGNEVSKFLAPIAISEGAIVIDNSSAWRMDPTVPLIIPEVNPEDIYSHMGLIANPNCSTTQMLVALKPIHDEFKIKRIVVSTYQAVSGTGKEAIDELNNQLTQYLNNEPIATRVYPYQILFNALPHIDNFLDNGYTKEEMKMVNETKRILDKHIEVTATTVRIPVFRGHSESVNIETIHPMNISKLKSILEKSPGIKVINDPESNLYPMPIQCEDRDEVFVGRIRKDYTVPNGVNMWIVSDNIRKGAALNAVQIGQLIIDKGLL